MKAWLRKISRAGRAKGLDLPPTPLPPPPFLGPAGMAGRRSQLAAYQGWVYAAVTAIADRVAGIPLRLFTMGEQGPGTELTRHPLLSLLARPNPIMTRREFKFTLVSHLELTGMAFALISQNALGLPAELWPLSPADLIEIEPGPDTTRPVAAFRFRQPGGGEARYQPGQLLYFRHPSPSSLIYGASPVRAMAYAFDIDLAVRIYQSNFFRNAARPEVVLSTDQRLTEDEARRILTRWNQKHQGLAHVFEPTVLDAGLKASPLNYSAKDFEFMALANWTQDNILAAFRLPAGKLGLVKDVNRANAHAIDVTFNSECIRPRLELIEEVLSAFLLPRFQGDLLLKHDNPVPADRAQNHREAMDQLDRGVITINEARAAQGRPPVDWGQGPLGRSKTKAPANQDALAQALARLYPRLEARMHGWSTPRVRRELAQNPGLLAELDGLGLAEPGRVKKALTQALAQGQTLEQLLKALALD